MTTMMKKIKVKQTGADTAELWVARPVAKVTTRSTTIIVIVIVITITSVAISIIVTISIMVTFATSDGTLLWDNRRLIG